MEINELGPAYGSVKSRKRVGRGIGSGQGKTSCRGAKGQKARTGGSIRRGFEGGQTPLYRRIPKRGFTNKFALEYSIINVSDLENYDNDSVVNLETLLKDGIVKKSLNGLKVLGNGELTKKLTVETAKITVSAKAKIEALGGKVVIK